jgi:transketolase
MYCWEMALIRTNGPSLITLCPSMPDTGPDIGSAAGAERPAVMDARARGSLRGGYVLEEAVGGRDVTLIASGPEVAIALAARALLAREQIRAAVVSLPCWELFATQSPAYRAQVLGAAPRVGIEAASGFGWERWLGDTGLFIGMDGFGAHATNSELYRLFGITPAAISARVRDFLSRRDPARQDQPAGRAQ